MKTLSVYDLDDTIFINHPFAHFVKTEPGCYVDIEVNYPTHFNNAKKVFKEKFGHEIVFKKIGNFIVPLDKEYEFTYSEKHKLSIDEKVFKNNFEIKDGIIVMRAFRGFHSEPSTLGREINLPVFEHYSKAENKMILTGRDEKLRTHLLNLFKELDFEIPNYGIKMYSTNIGIMKWKTLEILKAIEEHELEEIHFFEDRKDWLDYAEQTVIEKHPEIKFVAHYVDNVKKEHKLF